MKVQLDFFLMSALEFLSANKRIQCWGTLSNLGALSNKIPTEKPSSNLPPYLLGGSCVHSVFGKQCKHLKQFCLFSFIFFWAEKKTWLCKGSESKSLLAWPNSQAGLGCRVSGLGLAAFGLQGFMGTVVSMGPSDSCILDLKGDQSQILWLPVFLSLPSLLKVSLHEITLAAGPEIVTRPLWILAPFFLFLY